MSRPSDFFGPLPPNVTPTQGRRNYIINGNFDVWQRATSQTAAGYGSDDRWNNVIAGTARTHSRQSFAIGQTDVPNNPTYYSRTVVTSVAGAGNACQKQHRIEDVTKLSGKTVTVSFYAKADSVKNIAVELTQFFGSSGSPSPNVNIQGQKTSLSSSWAKKTFTFVIPSVAGKTVGTDNNHSTILSIWFDAGSDYSSRTDTLGQQSGTFDIAQVQLEEGLVATEFERRTYADELQLCHRYYQQIPEVSYCASCVSSATVFGMINFLQKMRAVPVVTRVGNLTVNDTAATYTSSGADGYLSSNSSCRIVNSGFTGLTTYRYANGHAADTRWTVDAEL